MRLSLKVVQLSARTSLWVARLLTGALAFAVLLVWIHRAGTRMYRHAPCMNCTLAGVPYLDVDDIYTGITRRVISLAAVIQELGTPPSPPS